MASRGRIVVLAVCGLVLAGCSGTRFGDQLARSFSSPPAAPPLQPDPPTRAPGPVAPAPPAAKPAAKAPPAPAPRPQPQTPSPSKPAPYRITIQLPSADPAAPAEAVTEALRAAGLRFEVEMIERIGAAPPPASPTASPTITPAPAPR